MGKTTLCLDIGSGTQDVLLYSPDVEIENCPKFVIPSPAIIIGHRIENQRMLGRNIWLHGSNMGGGVTRFIRAHQKAGLAVAASESAAYTMADDLTRVTDMGIELTDNCPDGFQPIRLTDFDEAWWRNFLTAAELPWPDGIAACAQDHGFHPGKSNRKGRFNLWHSFLNDAEGRPEALVYQTPPAMLTRLKDLQTDISGGMVADTGAAAVLGALYVDEIEKLSFETGVTLVNIGNSHLIAFCSFRVESTACMNSTQGAWTGKKLWSDLDQFRCGCLSFDQVFEERGHGCLCLDLPEAAAEFKPTFVLGPRRAMLDGYNVSFPAPGGDMMLAGCFGLIKGMSMKREK